jgi:outer membrane murein-binding lipoprotein Lpp
MSTAVALAGAIAAIIAAVVAGMFSLRGSRTAAAPQQRQVDLSVLIKSVEQLEKDRDRMEDQIGRLRAFLWVALRWALRLRDQVTDLGGTPIPAPAEVDEFYRTGA